MHFFRNQVILKKKNYVNNRINVFVELYIFMFNLLFQKNMKTKTEHVIFIYPSVGIRRKMGVLVGGWVVT